MKTLFTLSLLLASTSAFAMGRTDKTVIQPTLNEAKAAGFECKEVWPEKFYLGEVAPHGTYEVSVVCKDKAGNEKHGVITYQADGAQYARCRDTRALSIKFN